MKKIKKLLSITTASILLFSCGFSNNAKVSHNNNPSGNSVLMDDISSAQKSAAIQSSTNKYQEFVLAYIEYCQKDFNNYITNKAFWTQTDEYISIIINGAVKATEKSIAAAAIKIGTYDEANKQIIVIEGDVPVTYYLVFLPDNFDAYFENSVGCDLQHLG